MQKDKRQVSRTNFCVYLFHLQNGTIDKTNDIRCLNNHNRMWGSKKKKHATK